MSSGGVSNTSSATTANRATASAGGQPECSSRRVTGPGAAPPLDSGVAAEAGSVTVGPLVVTTVLLTPVPLIRRAPGGVVRPAGQCTERTPAPRKSAPDCDPAAIRGAVGRAGTLRR